jgi:uncharacterized membrane protein YeaQ/YmgE (transglycosylase-associated protein family)
MGACPALIQQNVANVWLASLGFIRIHRDLDGELVPNGDLKANEGGRRMFHLLWYVLIGLISGVIAKSVMHVHMTIFWTVVLGVIGSIIGGGVTHMFSRPSNDRYHPAGLILSTLGAILVLYICFKLNIHFPEINLSSR